MQAYEGSFVTFAPALCQFSPGLLPGPLRPCANLVSKTARRPRQMSFSVSWRLLLWRPQTPRHNTRHSLCCQRLATSKTILCPYRAYRPDAPPSSKMQEGAPVLLSLLRPVRRYIYIAICRSRTYLHLESGFHHFHQFHQCHHTGIRPTNKGGNP